MLDEKSLTAYRKRWQAVAAVEAAERQSSSITERWQQINALLRLAISLKILPPTEDASQDEGRQRWQTLYTRFQNKSS